MDRLAVEQRLQKLEVGPQSMLIDHPAANQFWPALAGEADLIEDGEVTAEDCRYVSRRVESMLQSADLREEP